MRTTNLQTRLNQIVAETLRQIAELESVVKYVRADEGDSSQLRDIEAHAGYYRTVIRGVQKGTGAIV